MKIHTLAFLVRGDEICLAMKKRGLGVGYRNGYGGKLEAEETIEQAAVREINEESSCVVEKTNLEKVAINTFLFEDGRQFEVHVFLVRVWSGEPVETGEMRPKWYAINEIPYDSMWADGPHWLPRVINGEKIRGVSHYSSDGRTMKDMVCVVVEEF